MKLNIYISVPGYLEKGIPRFTEVTEEYNEELNMDNV